MLGKIKDSAAYISRFLEGEKYRIGIILGTGLGELGKSIEIKHTIPYAGIPHFPVSTVQGHKGNLLIGKFGGKNVIAMQGRFHFYEGYPMQEVTFPIRVLHELGVKYLFVSNAAGGVNTQFLVGMSTVPEIIVARHMGMECFGMSVITNSTASPELIKTNHTEVQDIGNTAQPRMTALFREIIAELKES